VDAIAISMANLAKGGVELDLAVVAIILGVGSNTLLKAALANVVGGWAYGRQVLGAFAVTLAAGAAALLLLVR
jgi:uncharacterized membrane protein (DUF4010 family)